MKVLVTGAAGFIGFHLIKALLETDLSGKDHFIVGIDNLNDYYDIGLKAERLEILNSVSTPVRPLFTLNPKIT